MSNAEYLALLEQQNQMKKEKEMQSKEYQDRKKIEDREKGFNLYMGGANTNLPQKPTQPVFGTGGEMM